MIQANELRIGVWLYLKNSELLQIDIDNFSDCAKNPAIFDPIPLTPEILEKAGFKKVEDGVYGGSDYSSYEAWSIDGLILCIVGSNFHVWESCEEDSFYSYYRSNNIKYLHQLQNLYYALTQTELPITL